jgi:signal transduction histidine kinase
LRYDAPTRGASTNAPARDRRLCRVELKTLYARYRFAVWCSAGYAVLGVVWIVFSDVLLASLTSNPKTLGAWQAMNTALFIFASALGWLAVLASREHAQPVPDLGEIASPPRTSHAIGGAWSILTQIAVLVAATALPLAAALFYDVYSDAQNDLRDAERTAVNLARITAADTGALLRDSRNVLETLAKRPLVRSLDARHCDRAFSGFVDTHPPYTNLLSFDLEGNLVCSAVPPPPNASTRVDPQYFLDRVQKLPQVTIGKPARGFITGRHVVTIASPLFDDRGVMRGVLGLPVDLVSFAPVAARADWPPGTGISIYDIDGTLIARSNDPERYVGTRQVEDEAIGAVLKQRDGTLRATGTDKVEKIYGFVRIPEADWVAVAAIPTESILADTVKNAVRRSAVAATLITVVGLLAWLVGRRIVRPIRAIAQMAEAVGRGMYAVRAQPQGTREIDDVAAQLNHMLDTLEAERKRLAESEARYRQMNERLHGLSGQLIRVQESERRSLARELHDRVGQNLAALKLGLQLLESKLRLADPSAEPLSRALRRLTDAYQIIDAVVGQVRDVMAELRPPLLDEYGLLAALRAYVQRMAERIETPIEVHGNTAAPRPPAAAESALFAAALEAITNSLKHALADRIDIDLDYHDACWTLSVTDDGVGFEPNHSAREDGESNWGILTMRERIEGVGGRLRVEAGSRRGTRVVFELPRADTSATPG